MHVVLLQQFFLGELSGEDLARDLAGSPPRGRVDARGPAADLDDFVVRPEHLIRACDAVLGGEVEPGGLGAIGFCIVASDHFLYGGDTPEGALMNETVLDWATRGDSRPHGIEGVREIRERLAACRDSLPGAGRD